VWYYWFLSSSVSSTSTSVTVSTVPADPTNYTRVYYDLNGFTKVQAVTGTVSNTFSSYDKSNLNYVYVLVKLVQAFVLIALVFSLVVATALALFLFDSVRNKILFAIGTKVARIVIALGALVVLISTIIAFLAFLGFTNSLNLDVANCVEGPCKFFAHSTTTTPDPTTGVSQTETWGPAAGWWIDLATIPVALLLLVVVIVNKFPLPIDSEASSGEAL